MVPASWVRDPGSQNHGIGPPAGTTAAGAGLGGGSARPAGQPGGVRTGPDARMGSGAPAGRPARTRRSRRTCVVHVGRPRRSRTPDAVDARRRVSAQGGHHRWRWGALAAHHARALHDLDGPDLRQAHAVAEADGARERDGRGARQRHGRGARARNRRGARDRHGPRLRERHARGPGALHTSELQGTVHAAHGPQREDRLDRRGLGGEGIPTGRARDHRCEHDPLSPSSHGRSLVRWCVALPIRKTSGGPQCLTPAARERRFGQSHPNRGRPLP